MSAVACALRPSTPLASQVNRKFASPPTPRLRCIQRSSLPSGRTQRSPSHCRHLPGGGPVGHLQKYAENYVFTVEARLGRQVRPCSWAKAVALARESTPSLL